MLTQYSKGRPHALRPGKLANGTPGRPGAPAGNLGPRGFKKVGLKAKAAAQLNRAVRFPESTVLGPNGRSVPNESSGLVDKRSHSTEKAFHSG